MNGNTNSCNKFTFTWICKKPKLFFVYKNNKGPTKFNNEYSAILFFMIFIFFGVLFLINLFIGVLFYNFTKA